MATTTTVTNGYDNHHPDDERFDGEDDHDADEDDDVMAMPLQVQPAAAGQTKRRSDLGGLTFRAKYH